MNASKASVLIEYMLGNLVDDPGDLSVTSSQTDSGTEMLEISVSSRDLGLVIGKSGRTAQSLRSLAELLSTHTHVPIEVTIAGEA